MSKEIIELLKKARTEMLQGGPYTIDYKDGFNEAIDQAIYLLKQQPTAGEFTKMFRILLATQDRTAVVQDAYKLCDIIGSAEARLKVIPDLLEACQKALWLLEFMVKENILNADYSIKGLLEAAIAKAKKVRE